MIGGPAEEDMPWWSTSGARGTDAPEAAEAILGNTLADLASGAHALLEWARRSMLDSHASHEDPAAHPRCLVCQANVTLSRPARSAGETGDARVWWIELDPPEP